MAENLFDGRTSARIFVKHPRHKLQTASVDAFDKGHVQRSITLGKASCQQHVEGHAQAEDIGCCHIKVLVEESLGAGVLLCGDTAEDPVVLSR